MLDILTESRCRPTGADRRFCGPLVAPVTNAVESAWPQKERDHAMPTLPLTDSLIKSAKTRTKRLQITDARCQGLELRVTPAGAKSFAFKYRSKRDSKVIRLTLGSYPDLPLAKARSIVEDHRRSIAAGSDPRDRKHADVTKAKAHGTTFDEVAELYLEQYAKPNKASWRDDESMLRRPRARWGKLPVRAITDDHVATLLDEIAAEAPVSANRTQSILHTLFRWAKEPGRKYITINPLADMKRRTKEKPKERVLTDDEIRKVWHALDAGKINRSIALTMKTILLTAARPGMVAGMLAEELHDLDGKSPEWHLPAHRMKNGRPFILPLSPQAVAIIKDARPGPDEPVIFPSPYHHRASLTRSSLSRAAVALVTHLGMEKWTPHDLRRTAATLARRHGVPRDHVRALLAHTESDVTAVYDRFDMLPEKRDAAVKLAAAVASITG
jgi:integrase